MKKLNLMTAAAVAMLTGLAAQYVDARELVIIQTNDTHSQIDPTDKGFGGVQRRKVFVDSVRTAQPDVLLIDSGDAVQGTLFFNLYGGEVEMKVMNNLGYDVAVLGNHDFDNGLAAMAKNVAMSNAQWLSANYKFDDPEIAKMFKPYKIFTYGDKRVGFIGLNVNPKGMIADKNAVGVTYLDAVDAANATAWWLKNQEGVDVVVAVTHIGYENVPSPTDVDVASKSKDIDIILGGHSHTLISPNSGKEWVLNAVGDSVLVTQNKKTGEYITEITLDLDNLAKKPAFRQVRLGAAYDRTVDEGLTALVAPYRKGVDELMQKPICKTAVELPADHGGLLNFISDFVYDRGTELNGAPVDLSLMNVGSLRRGLPKGDVSEGMLLSMQPFPNYILVLDLKGQDLIDAMKVYASRGGDGVSSQVRATFDPDTKELVSLTVNGKAVDPDKTYKVATIDYLAGGGDYMTPLKNGQVTAKSADVVSTDLINYVKTRYSRKKISPSTSLRFSPSR
jgi:5'-nucleotidase